MAVRGAVFATLVSCAGVARIDSAGAYDFSACLEIGGAAASKPASG